MRFSAFLLVTAVHKSNIRSVGAINNKQILNSKYTPYIKKKRLDKETNLDYLKSVPRDMCYREDVSTKIVESHRVRIYLLRLTRL